jgi:hypothetical protein
MNYEDFDHLASGLSSLATILALGIGALWTYQRFVRTREANPKIQFTVDISFVIQQNGFWVAEALAFLENKGLVRHDIKTFSFDVRYFLEGDPIHKDVGFTVYVPNEDDESNEGSWLPKEWGSTYIEPGLLTRYSSLIRIPVAATAVLIHGKFMYSDDDWHTADKLVRVPKPAQLNAPAELR